MGKNMIGTDGAAGPRAHDAWALRRLLTGQDLNGELESVSGPFRAIARRLAGLAPEDRLPVWEGFLDGQPDRDDILRALAEVDPLGPPPAADADDPAEDEGWGPMRLKALPRAAPFPVEVFPEVLQRYCREAARATLAPLDFIGATMLGVAGAAIGQSVNVRVKRTWNEAPLLYIVVVAPPGRAKTPAMRLVVKPLTEIDRQLRKQSQEARDAWEEAKKAHAKDPNNHPPPGPEPPQRRAIVKDITRESLALILQDNPRGVLCDPDEAGAWVASFNEYKAKGADRQFWLSNWSCTSISVDRKGGRESLYVPYPFAAVVGGLPPAMLGNLADEHGRNDGFIDRILFTYPDEGAYPPQRWTEAELGEDAERDWSDIIRRLHETAMTRDPEAELERPFSVAYAPEAKAIWADWFAAHAAETEAPGFPEDQAGAWSKLRTHAARFALILSRLRWACDPTSGPLPGPITAADLRGAIALADYFKSHLARVIHEVTGGMGSPDARSLVRWIRSNGLAAFSQRDVTRNLPRFRLDPEALDAALSWLTERNIIRRRPDPDRTEGRRGRKATPTYEVHPSLSAPQN
jgi:hypothetical protein